jgi:glycosyltransferase involved in cell wall biosynthesis
MSRPPLAPAPTDRPALRVLHVIAGLGVRSGGPSSALAGLAAAQAAAGLAVGVLTAAAAPGEPTLADDLAARGVRVTAAPAGGRPVWPGRAFAAAVSAAVAGADVVHLHGAWEPVLHAAAVAARRRGVPYLFTPHGMLDPWALRQKAWKKRLYRLLSLDRDLRGAAAVHFAADRERDLSLSAGRGMAGGALTADRWREPGLTVVEPFGIDAAEFDPPPPAGRFRARFPATAGRKVVAFLGRLHPGKGAEHLIPAMRHVTNPAALLVVAGPDSGDFGRVLREAAATSGVEGRVLFTGMLRGPDRLDLLADADLFALPSEHENFGIVVAEAMACGCPVLVSDEVNLGSAVAATDAGVVVPMAPAADLPARVAVAIDAELARGRDAAERERIRAAALAAFDWTAIGRRWVGHYEAIVRPAANARFNEPQRGGSTIA